MQMQTPAQTVQQGMRQDDCVSELVARPWPSKTRQAHRTDRRARCLVLRRVLSSRRVEAELRSADFPVGVTQAVRLAMPQPRGGLCQPLCSFDASRSREAHGGHLRAAKPLET